MHDISLNLFLISKRFHLPPDITKYIFFIINNYYSSIIQNAWFNYIGIHSTNLILLTYKIPLLSYFSPLYNIFFSYYDVTHTAFPFVIKTCYKYYRPNISSHDWWFKFISNCINGFNLSTVDNNVINNYYLFHNFFYKYYSFIQ